MLRRKYRRLINSTAARDHDAEYSASAVDRAIVFSGCSFDRQEIGERWNKLPVVVRRDKLIAQSESAKPA